MVITITNTEMFMERSLEERYISSLPFSILQTVRTDTIRKSRWRAGDIKPASSTAILVKAFKEMRTRRVHIVWEVRGSCFR